MIVSVSLADRFIINELPGKPIRREASLIRKQTSMKSSECEVSSFHNTSSACSNICYKFPSSILDIEDIDRCGIEIESQVQIYLFIHIV